MAAYCHRHPTLSPHSLHTPSTHQPLFLHRPFFHSYLFTFDTLQSLSTPSIPPSLTLTHPPPPTLILHTPPIPFSGPSRGGVSCALAAGGIVERGTHRVPLRLPMVSAAEVPSVDYCTVGAARTLLSRLLLHRVMCKSVKSVKRVFRFAYTQPWS